MKNRKLITIITSSVAGLILLVLLLPLAFGKGSGSSSEDRSDGIRSADASHNRSYEMPEEDGDYYLTAETTIPYYDDYEYEYAGSSDLDFAANYAEPGFDGGAAPLSSDGAFEFTELADSEANPSKLIRTMSLTVETVQFNVIDSDIRARVVSMNGYFQDSSVSGTGNTGDPRRGYYVIRIPADRLDEFVSYFGNNCTVTSRSESTRDVTLDYVDTQSRISSLRTEMEVLTGMLEDCDDLDNLIVLQSRITEIRYEIENYESQLRTVDNQVDYSTLTLNLYEVTVEQESEPIQEYTFSQKVSMAYKDGLEELTQRGKDVILNISHAVPGLLAVLAIIVFIAVIILIVFFIVRSSIRRSKKKRAAKQEPSKPDDSTAFGKPE